MNVKTIDCYDIEEVGEEINEITKRYKTVLSTTGEKKIEKWMPQKISWFFHVYHVKYKCRKRDRGEEKCKELE